MPLPLILLMLVLCAVAAGSGYLLGASSAKEPPAGAELAERDAFIEKLREIAWQHRDISPELATIMIDEIATRHRQLPPS